MKSGNENEDGFYPEFPEETTEVFSMGACSHIAFRHPHRLRGYRRKGAWNKEEW